MKDRDINFSIVLPCYNISKYLSDCLDSIFANDVTDCEIILVDDGSTDGFLQCIQDYFKHDFEGECCNFLYKNATVIVIFKQNGGISSARNRGVLESSKEYILFVDPDDTVSDDWIFTLENKLKNTKSDMCIFGFSTVYSDATKNYTILPQENYNLKSNSQCIDTLLPRYLGKTWEQTINWGKTGKFIPKSEFGSVWRVAYRRALIIDNGIHFNESIILNEDGVFNSWCIVHSSCISSINKSLYNYNVRLTGALSSNVKMGEKLIYNKAALLHERIKILEYIEKSFKIDLSHLIYGSVIFSVIELMMKNKFTSYKKIKNTYIKEPFVAKVIRKMDFIGKKSFDIVLFLMKAGMFRLLFVFIRIANKLGFKSI